MIDQDNTTSEILDSVGYVSKQEFGFFYRTPGLSLRIFREKGDIPPPLTRKGVVKVSIRVVEDYSKNVDE